MVQFLQYIGLATIQLQTAGYGSNLIYTPHASAARSSVEDLSGDRRVRISLETCRNSQQSFMSSWLFRHISVDLRTLRFPIQKSTAEREPRLRSQLIQTANFRKSDLGYINFTYFVCWLAMASGLDLDPFKDLAISGPILHVNI